MCDSPLGERGHELWVVADECGVDALLLQEFSNELVEQACGGVGGRAVDAVLDDEGHQLQACGLRVQVSGHLAVEGSLQARHLIKTKTTDIAWTVWVQTDN